MASGEDFLKVPRALKLLVKELLGIELVEMKSDTRRPALPFATYEVTNPYLPHSQHNSPADGFSIQVQLGFHGALQQETLQTALNFRAALERSSSAEFLSNCGVHFERVLDVYNRPTLLVGEAYEYVAGVDVQLGLEVSVLADDAAAIEEFHFDLPNGGTIKI